MMKQIMPTFASLLLFCIHFTSVFAQAPAPAAAPPAPTTPAPVATPPAPVAIPPAPTTSVTVLPPGPSPPGTPNVIAILTKAGKYTTFIRLLKSTQTAERIRVQLNTSTQGVTVLAPTDGAFANLRSGALNSYTDEQKSELVQAHLLPTFISVSQFQTVSNPMRTQAGGTNYGEYPLNVTTSGNSVNLTTGFVNASIISAIYSNKQLAVYELDHVLLPQRFFVTPPPSSPPAPAPAPSKPKKRPQPTISTAAVSSDAVSLIRELTFQATHAFAVLAASWLFG